MAAALRGLQGKALVSINDHPAIRECFAGFHMESLDISYTVGGGRQASRAARVGDLVVGPGRGACWAVLGGYDRCMLVEVIRLRHLGAKLPKDQLGQPVRGSLELEPQPGAPLANGTAGSHLVVFASLRDAAGSDLLPPLRDVIVTRVRGDSLVLLGLEVRAGPMRSSSATLQAWACRLVAI